MMLTFRSMEATTIQLCIDCIATKVCTITTIVCSIVYLHPTRVLHADTVITTLSYQWQHGLQEQTRATSCIDHYDTTPAVGHWDQARPLNQEDGCAQLWLKGHHRQFADTQVLQTSSECF